MNFSILLLLVVFCATARTEEVVYQGIRVDMCALTLNRDILACITPAMNRTLNHTFRSLSDHAALTSLYIGDIKVMQPSINENLFDMNKFTYDPPIYNLSSQSGCVSFTLSFSYEMTFLGLTIASGTGTGVVNNEAKGILVFFNETHPDVQLPHPWDVTNIRLSGSIFTPAQWIEDVLEDKFIHDFHKVVDDAMFDFANKLLAAYERVEDIFGDEMDLIYYNHIIDVKPTIDKTYMSIGFGTNITVNNNKVRKMHREIAGSVAPFGHFSLCMAAELLPDSLDSLGKAGYHDFVMDPEIWGFEDNTVKCLFPILPELTDRYDGTENFTINCMSSPSETINDLAHRGSATQYLEMQYPFHCAFFVNATFEDVLRTDIYARFAYIMNGTEQAYNGFIQHVELYGFNTLPNLAPPRRKILNEFIVNFVMIFEEADVIAPGIRVVPNRRSELEFKGFETRKEEICFWYDEKRSA
eukprot:TRINITY_DN7673_c0_g1_i3.p1 TRINITY_DN7673_c0_g1~~TRINITY_DN7673_c0_g1_i3.p1  ORF type:complete len:469 (+),score=103.73 TRINITY_DN7673_c0_g1_i3:202-1608(+)